MANFWLVPTILNVKIPNQLSIALELPVLYADKELLLSKKAKKAGNFLAVTNILNANLSAGANLLEKNALTVDLFLFMAKMTQ